MLTQAWLEGSLGGACLALGRFLLTIITMDHSSGSDHKYGRLVAAHVIAGLAFALLGGAVSWAMEGKSGNFMQGIGAMVLLGLLAGKMMDDPQPATSRAGVSE